EPLRYRPRHVLLVRYRRQNATPCSAVKEPVAAAPPDQAWSPTADDGISRFGIRCHAGGPAIGFVFYLDDYHGNAPNKLKDDIKQSFLVEIRQASGDNRSFPSPCT